MCGVAVYMCGVVLTSALTELFLAATKFPLILQLFSGQRTYFVITLCFLLYLVR
jgi:hypothetical protein